MQLGYSLRSMTPVLELIIIVFLCEHLSLTALDEHLDCRSHFNRLSHQEKQHTSTGIQLPKFGG